VEDCLLKYANKLKFVVFIQTSKYCTSEKLQNILLCPNSHILVCLPFLLKCCKYFVFQSCRWLWCYLFYSINAQLIVNHLCRFLSSLDMKIWLGIWKYKSGDVSKPIKKCLSGRLCWIVYVLSIPCASCIFSL